MAWVNIRGRLLVGSSEDDELGRALLPAAITIDASIDELMSSTGAFWRGSADAGLRSPDLQPRTAGRRPGDHRQAD
jgi:hypothetical protein